MKTLPHSSQILRPVSRLNRMPRSRFISTTESSGVPSSFSIFSNASAWAMLRGKPSKMKPLAASGLLKRSRIMPSTVASSTSLPASMAALARKPEFRALGDGFAQQIAGGYLRDAVSLYQQLRLRAFARPGRSQ